MASGERPVESATSLAIERASTTDREPLLREILRRLEVWYRRWLSSGGDADVSGLRQAYRDVSATIGRHVRVQLPDGQDLSGMAIDVDEAGRLIVRALTGEVAINAGDVIHLR
jgi:BirA family biotin operon repressor/biotin-[acetyl-CoA-carboxylase] ligase